MIIRPLRLVFVLAVASSAPVVAAPVVLCDAATQRVVRFDSSANTSDFIGNPQARIDPPGLTTLVGVRVDHWLCVPGDVREMTPAEKAALAAEIDAIRVQAAKAEAKAEFDQRYQLSMLKYLVQQLNTLRALHGLPPLTRDQVIAAIKADVDAAP
jgi:uncharacterized protein YkwD